MPYCWFRSSTNPWMFAPCILSVCLKGKMSGSDFSLRGQCRGTCASLWGAVAQAKPGDMQREGPSLGRTRVVAASPLSPSGSTSVGNAGRRPDLSLQRRNACAQLAHPVRVPTRVIHPVITYVPVRPRRERWPRRPPMEVSVYAPPRAQGHLGDDARRRHDPSAAPWCVRQDPSVAPPGEDYPSLGVVGSSGKPRTRKASGKRPTVGLSVRPKAAPAHCGHTTAAP
jgi:hypothetical protein